MPSNQTLFLHIGTEKTGTTTLQTMLSSSRETLASQDLLYPRTPGRVNHVGAALYALDMEDRPDLRSSLGLQTLAELAAYRDRFIEDLALEIERSKCRTVLISNEHLSSRLTRPEQIERLVRGLEQITPDLRVIMYLRPQYELAPSWYSTSIKSGNTESFSPPSADGNYFYNYDKQLQNWESAISQRNITVRLFGKKNFIGANLVDDFFLALGMRRPDSLVVPSDKNKSLDAETLEFLRIANKHVPWFVNGEQNSSRSALIHAIEAISANGSAVADTRTLSVVDAIFRESNRRVAVRYFPERLDLFEPYTPEPSASNPAGVLTPERAVEIAINLWMSKIDTLRKS